MHVTSSLKNWMAAWSLCSLHLLDGSHSRSNQHANCSEGSQNKKASTFHNTKQWGLLPNNLAALARERENTNKHRHTSSDRTALRENVNIFKSLQWKKKSDSGCSEQPHCLTINRGGIPKFSRSCLLHEQLRHSASHTHKHSSSSSFLLELTCQCNLQSHHLGALPLTDVTTRTFINRLHLDAMALFSTV